MDRLLVSPLLARVLRVAVASSLALAGPVHAQAVAQPAPAADRGSFVVLTRTDTVTVERFTRTATGVDATLSIVGGGRLRHVIAYAPKGGRIAQYRTEFFPADSAQGASPAQRAAYSFVGDSMMANVSDQPTGYRVILRSGALPWLNRSVVLLEEIARQVRSTGATRVEVPVVNLENSQQFAVVATAVGRDTIALAFGSIAIHLAVDPRGRVLGGRIPSQGVTIVRTGGTAAGVGAIRRADGPASRDVSR